MRMDLSKEEETKMLPSESLGLVSMSVSQNEFMELCLEDRLIQFDKEVIRKECPNTSEEHQLMQPKMLEMLLEYEPTNLAEFGDRIPRYFRKPMESLHPRNPDSQTKFIKQIVSIIDEYGEK